jgi:hypothetical protein
MSNRRPSQFLPILPRWFVCLPLALAACGDSPPEAHPDAAAPEVEIPISPAGRYIVTSTFSLAAAPPNAAAVLDELNGAVDGPDDPSRYLIDLMIARLPEGNVRTFATVLAPYVAAYVNARVTAVAPHFVTGARELSTGLAHVAHQFGTRESFDIASDGALRWTTSALHFDAAANTSSVTIALADVGLAEMAAQSQASIAGDRMSIGRATFALPYTTMLRLGFDRAVIPHVTPGAHDLAGSLQKLVDCAALGVLVEQFLGVGSPDFYASGCRHGLTALASRIYERMAAIAPESLALELTGTARAVDNDHDGTLDAIADGAWSGTLSDLAVTGNFTGARR